MNPVADAAKLLGNLAGLGQQFAFANNPRYGNQQNLPSCVTSMSADATAGAIQSFGLLQVYRASGPEEAKKLRENASIISWALGVVDVLELLTGFGPPETGDVLEEGSQQLTGLSAQLCLGIPDGGWQGAAAQRYADHDAALQDLVVALADLDTQFASLVKDQAAWVTLIREGFGYLKDLLVAALIIEIALRWVFGPPEALKFAIAVCTLGIIAAQAMLGGLAYVSVENANQVDALTTQYTQAVVGIAAGNAVVSIQRSTADQYCPSAAEVPTMAQLRALSKHRAEMSGQWSL